MAQGSPTYVITRDGHYLAHPGSGSTYSLTDAPTFDPATCLWFSGPNVEHNYYFIDDNGDYRYLSAPLAINGQLSLSDSHPGTVVLNKTSQNYYFYDWDHGVARGVQHDTNDCDENYHGWNALHTQCWEVVWVSYENNTWKMSSTYGYEPTTYFAQFKSVAITQHAAQVVPDATNPGGAPVIADFAMAYGDAPHPLNGTATTFSYTYTPAYTSYVIDGTTYYFDANGNSIANAPTATSTTNNAGSYSWTLTGDGAAYLSLSANNIANPTLSCTSQNTTSSHKMATLTLTVTYGTGTNQVTETRTATVTVKTQCQNPQQASAPVITYEYVTVSWLPTDDSYTLYWQKDGDGSTWLSTTLGNVTSYTFTGMDYAQKYNYKVKADCTSADPTVYSFTTSAAPDVVILGSVYGGGRMADVDGDTEVVLVNCDSVYAVFGGNDIAGTVTGGSTITLGVNANDANATAYNNNAASTKVRVFDVYGGGNGYYAYNGTSFVAASSEYKSQVVAVNGSVNAMTQSNQVGNAVWTNTGNDPVTLTFPEITSAAIIMNTDFVKVDSIFGGAKNAFITAWSGNGSVITINGGTAYAVFGGNNIGGGQNYGKHHIEVYGTKTDLSNSTVFGRDFGIAYLFGGGNKVYGSTAEVFIYGGQCDTVFAGGNSASVYAANATVNCPLDKTISNAIASYSGSTITFNDNYPWNGSGVYNVRTLFGGNNRAQMDCLPNVTLTSGAAGTVYGGGNAGDMMHQKTDSITFNNPDFDDYTFDYSTKVVMNSPTMLVDNLYGGCQMSNVGYSTWVQVQNGHVGTVYGGCNISGDVGSTRVNMSADPNNPDGQYQIVYGATYVEVSGGTVHKDVFAGSNGFYHCLDANGISYVEHNNIVYDPLGRTYYGENVPTHNETHVIISGTATVKNNVYAGGNLAPVGFTTNYVHNVPYAYPYLVGLAAVRMIGGEVQGDVYGGGRMASINGSNEVRVTAGTIGGALYGGNDRLGQAGQISNRVLPSIFDTASDNHTPLTSGDQNEKVNTYVGVTGNPHINTVYGGGNGAYNYNGTSAGGDMDYCDAGDLPIQKNIFVDIAIDGSQGTNGAGYIENVYGGGNGVYTDGFVKVFVNVRNALANDPDHIGTVYGGNNMGNMDTIPDIILLHGNVNTVYGGCNSGAMTGVRSYTGNDGTIYNNIGSLVHLRSAYTAGGTTVTPDARVTGAVYGGCRMNGVNNNTLVLVEHGNHTADLFGGSDISGTISGTSHVVVKDGTVGNVYGGGNGGYYYDGNKVYDINNHSILIDTSDVNITAPVCAVSLVDIMDGQVGSTGTGNSRSVFGGGYGHETSITGNVTVNIGLVDAASAGATPTIYGDIYGGSALGTVNTNSDNTTTVNIFNGTLNGNVYGGGLGQAPLNANGYIDTNSSDPTVEALVNGTVQVNIGNSDETNYSNYLNINGSVFGGNNLAGTPLANVYVDVYRTAHNSTNAYPTSLTLPVANSYFDNQNLYALREVYGGGNLAHYEPTSTEAATYVHVHNCDNTIQYVYGGGNAASVPTNTVTIDGGLIQYVFGGGNGAGEGNPGANVIGDNHLYLDGGVMGYVFGGSNTKGGVFGVTNLFFAETPSCSPRSINELYGGGNQATDENGITLNIPCGTSGVNVIYGGARMADVGTSETPANIIVNVKGGELDAIYGGNNISGTIYGDVTLNLHGGTIDKAFGGNNAGGDILGDIIVNVLDTVAACPLNVNTVYGGGNMAAYTPTDSTTASPQVNVIHGTVNDAVYGGGMGSAATVTANPIVTIGDNNANHKAIVGALLIDNSGQGSGNVYGGGDAAAVIGSTTVIYQDTHSDSQVNNLFGGGNQANAGGATVNMNSGTVLANIYGGCNTAGTVTGDISVNLNGGTVTYDAFGGGMGNATATQGNVTVTIDGGLVSRDVYGGSALGQVNDATDDLTKVWLKSGTITGNLYGGGMGDAEHSTDTWGQVNGNVEVHVNGGSVDNVFGCNNYNEEPAGTVKVYVNETTANTMTIGGNVYGGGNVAYYEGTPEVYIQNGTITNKVFGGGNNIATSDKGVGGALVEMTGGTVLDGIYGGCNADGDVTGDVTVTLTGGTVGASGAGNEAYIHGGGYGQLTTVAGNITVNFGELIYDNSNKEVHTVQPMLYGELYGGSALGNVNTSDIDNENPTTTTTVNLLNGTINGSVFGGGLGQKNGVNGATSNIAALVHGKVNVQVGKVTLMTPSATNNEVLLEGMADLVNCDIYGCNNVNGTPKNEVYVRVYKTYHITTNEASYLENDATYAIENIFGGGNQANFEPIGYNDYASFTETGSHRTHIYLHGCNNTARNVYGGGNAADAFGVVTILEGGRYNEIFGGGNGMVTPANIGMGGIGRRNISGHVNFQFDGSNRQGENQADTVYLAPIPTVGTIACGSEMIVDSYFFGSNQAEIYTGLNNSITCDESSDYNYRYVYAGSRWAVIFGDVNLTVDGGTIENLFGGSRGYNESGNVVASNIRKYPPADYDWTTNPLNYSEGLHEFMNAHPDLAGKGGNINLTINGGTIGNVFGGCDILGNVEGKITIIVNETDDDCDLLVGNVYGASNLTSYEPTGTSVTDSPEVKIVKGQVGFTTNVFYSSEGNNKTFEGNIFGGGNHGDCTSSPKVVIGTVNNANKVTIDGNVYGGGNEGDVDGSPKVIIVPTE